ncbi:histidine phosphatase family protein [Pelagovum pacificum]|uniref:Histidine phosphatase family protein n=1 Tax=Pelagovum pacificum TaxID=2588711 RepID=A0A5C5GB82_9RHOB|nr:histidine phosphatase family protein [Pelagovum pacificum]QQA42146.1 histidine phosphatase family protein [Pelagovum pacificum]TNY31234.1 histidine phosphatase family protein [Pelagovum pacificum]
MKLFWVRHGPTHQKAFTGHRDVPADLSDTAKVERLSAFLPAEAVVVSSDLQRAVSTADAICAGRRRLSHRPALREFDFGVWDGLTFDEVAARDPELSRRFWEVPGDAAPPGGESWNTLLDRVTAETDRLIAEADGRDIVIVAHIGVIMMAIQRAAACAPTEAMSHEIAPLSVTETMLDAGWSLGRVNHQP